jgi:DNA polymerase III delta subunit
LIESKRPDYALRTLSQLLKNGEKPERILGGLRYSFQRGPHTPLEIRKAIKLLLNCDITIKTGRLKPEFALERLVVKLCGS